MAEGFIFFKASLRLYSWQGAEVSQWWQEEGRVHSALMRGVFFGFTNCYRFARAPLGSKLQLPIASPPLTRESLHRRYVACRDVAHALTEQGVISSDGLHTSCWLKLAYKTCGRAPQKEVCRRGWLRYNSNGLRNEHVHSEQRRQPCR